MSRGEFSRPHHARRDMMKDIQDLGDEVKNLPSIEYLRECFEVDFETGVLRWKVRPVSHFEDGVKKLVKRYDGIWN
jgi:hypothetical protein